jgi:signal transduction histidine kinase/HAMP domain-containing protein
VFLVVIGQTLVALSGEVTDHDRLVSVRGTLTAQQVAAAAVGLMDSDNPRRFDGLIERVASTVDLLELTLVDRDGRIIGHSDGARVGEREKETVQSLFDAPRNRPGLSGLFAGTLEYNASAAIVRGTSVLGFVGLRFRSAEVSERASGRVVDAMAAALFWVMVASGFAILFVRRITRPLEALTGAAVAVSEDRLDDIEIERPRSSDEVGVLQGTFRHLVEALKGARAVNADLLGEQRQLNLKLQDRVEAVNTDLADTAAALQETTAYLRSVIGCIEEGILTVDRTGAVVQVNQGAARQLRGLADPKPGQPLAACFPRWPELAEALRAAIEEDRSSQLRLTRVVEQAPAAGNTDADPLGTRRSVVFRVYPLRADEQQRGGGAVVTVFDESAQVQMDARLRRQDRLASLGTIAAGLAHELGNYMHTINGFSQVALRSLAPEHPAHGDVRAIHDDNAAAIALLDRFLQFARPSGGEHRPEPIGALVRQALEICSYKVRKAGVEIIDKLLEEDPLVECDSRLLQQVFINLVLNAADAMAELPERTLVVGSRMLEDGRVELMFSDTGRGIEPEILDRIYDPFFTTKADKGTGLGLSIVHQIVDRHGGTITVRSLPMVGTTFRITLPVADLSGGDA